VVFTVVSKSAVKQLAISWQSGFKELAKRLQIAGR